MSEPARTNLARQAPQGGQVVQADAASLMQIISRASADPNTDMDKLERLLGMYERITARNAQAEYAEALATMQPLLPEIQERGEIKHGEGKPVQSRYAKWEDITAAIKPILADNGFSLSHRCGEEAGKITVTGVLSHRAGHTEQTTITLPVDMSGSKNAVQGVGSALTYGQRYTAKLLLNLTSRGSDDDGVRAGVTPVSPEQVRTLDALISASGADRTAFLKYLGVEAVEDIPAGKFKVALAGLNAKKRATAKAGAPQ